MFTQLGREAHHVCVYVPSCDPYTACVEVLQTSVPKSSGRCPNMILEYSTITTDYKLGPHEAVQSVRGNPQSTALLQQHRKISANKRLQTFQSLPHITTAIMSNVLKTSFLAFLALHSTQASYSRLSIYINLTTNNIISPGSRSNTRNQSPYRRVQSRHSLWNITVFPDSLQCNSTVPSKKSTLKP
jgi:hypothetical protein